MSDTCALIIILTFIPLYIGDVRSGEEAAAGARQAAERVPHGGTTHAYTLIQILSYTTYSPYIHAF